MLMHGHIPGCHVSCHGACRYSTTTKGWCDAPDAPPGECKWRLAEVPVWSWCLHAPWCGLRALLQCGGQAVKRVNKTCSDEIIYSTVEAHDTKDCFSK